MTHHPTHAPHHGHDVPPDELEPGANPVEPDQGPIPPVVPADDEGPAAPPAV